MHSRSRLIRNGVMAVLAGSTAGTAVGLWSVRHWTPNVTVAVQKPAAAVSVTSSSASPGADTVNAALARREQRPAVDGGDRQDLLQRARVLAARPDVQALVELRADISRRAEERGETESAATKRLLGELDGYLTKARQLRLKLDNEEFRKTAAASRPR